MKPSSFQLPRPVSGATDLLSLEQLEEHSRRLAASLSISPRGSGSGGAHLRRLRGHMRALRQAYAALAEEDRTAATTPAAEWLLDNFHVVSATARDIQHDLPVSFFRRLPTVAADTFAGWPRVYVLALELIGTSAGRLDGQRLQRFVSAFQSVTPLTMGELWAWPSALKLALVDHLREHADGLLLVREHRRSADRLATALESPSADTPWPSEIHHAFVTRLLQRMRALGSSAASVHRELDDRLAGIGSSIEDSIRAEGQHQAREQAAVANLINSLRLISTFDWSEFFESVSLVEQVLQRDPAGVYPRMDFLSRDRYRHAVEELAEPTGEAQLLLALKSVERARQAQVNEPGARAAHLGYHLIGGGRRRFEASIAWRPTTLQRARRFCFARATPLYLGAITIGTVGLLAATLRVLAAQGWRGGWALLALALLAIPATEFVIQVLQRAIAALIPPRRLPRLDLAEIPSSARTMVIVPTLLDSEARVEELLAHLEVQALGNLDANLHFAIISDFVDASAAVLPQDDAILRAARAGIADLNRRHPAPGHSRFFLFHRARQWNPREGLWMGWERKRGKIEEFNRFLRGATDTSFVVHDGDLALLPTVRYCITLDSDTRLPRGVARELVGIITHPLNQATVNPQVGRVTEGYGILQPRVSVTFMSAAGSLFARLYAGHTGVDPYTTAVSDTYQDLFGEGIFTGKGLYDVDAFIAVLGDTIPENALLSHDLFEGLHARVGLVSDIELVDDYPSSVLSHARRQHRWVRGDWQILRWLFPVVPSSGGPRRNRLPAIARWKIIDNLRRSLVAPMLLLVLLAGWTVLPGQPLMWTAAVVAVAASQLLPLAARLLTGPARAQSLPVFLTNLRHDTANAGAQVLLSLTLLAFHAVDAAHAIGVTLVRLGVTRRRMLEWETAAAAARNTRLEGRRGLLRFVSEMRASPLIAVVAAAVVAALRPSALVVAAPFMVAWLVAPAVAYWLSVPVGTRERPLSERERLMLRRTARLTWRYFESFVTADDGWLAPDNVQESDNVVGVAHRTSPTNIGMSLLSTLAAYDLGYINGDDLLRRVDVTLSTLESLERHEGHFLNWYDTATRAPLLPRYVSTVDSGNLVGALMTLASGLTTLAGAPQPIAIRREGLADALRVLIAVSASSAAAPEWRPEFAEAHRLGQTLLAACEGTDAAAEGLSEEAVQPLADIAARLPASPMTEVSDVRFWCEVVAREVAALDTPSSVNAARAQALVRRTQALVDATDFRFVYDRRRRIFAIGYRLADAEGPGRLDGAFYDLLASEARLASFIAIAKGDVPPHHWFHLGRLVTNLDGRAALMSWGGTMFEYLMPQLLMRAFPGTLIDQSCRAIVRRQVDYGRQRRVPWGISEAAYAFTDRAGNYQYRAFGVPGLGLKRGLSSDLVIAPYATALASQVTPATAVANFEQLSAAGAEGRFGYYESIDYTPRNREPQSATPDAAPIATIVRAYFAHHQGMSLVALTNVIAHDVFVNRFHAVPRVQATELLLQERVPREAILSEPRPAETLTTAPTLPVFASRQFRSTQTRNVHMHFLSNGRYTVALSSNGGGYSLFRDLAVTRRRTDPTADAGSQFIFLRDPWSGQCWSATYQPDCHEPDRFETIFELDKVICRRRDDDLDSQLEITVSSEDDVEVRRLTLTNRAARSREVEVTSYVEVALARPTDDLAHPAFGKLFVETEFDPQSAGLLFLRRARSAGETPPVAFHVLGSEGARRGGAIEWETDRARFVGRGRAVSSPAMLDGHALSRTTGAVLDPIGALRERVRLGPGASVRLTFATGVAGDRAQALTLARKYRDGNAAARAFSMAFTHVHFALQHLDLSDEMAILCDRLASRVFGADRSCQSPPDLLANQFGQQNLWGYGISGDLPIVLLRVREVAGLALVRQVLKAQEYWRLKALRADVIVVNEHAADYLDEMQQLLLGVVQEPQWAAWSGRPGGVFLLRAEGMAAADRHLFGACARVVLDDERGDLATQLDRPDPREREDLEVPRTLALRPAKAGRPPTIPPLMMFNGTGGFTADGREFVIVLEGSRDTPLPWSNVLANPQFGTIISSAGAAFTWAGNSRENRLTPFANDPLTDPTAEAVFLRDDDSGEVWTPTPGPLPRQPGTRWLVRHTAGASCFESAIEGLSQSLTVFVDPQEPVKVLLLTLTNVGATPRRVSVFTYVEWCLGAPREDEQRFVVTEFDRDQASVLARNAYNTDFATATAFLRCTEPIVSVTGDRTEFIGRDRTLAAPAALLRPRLSDRTGAGLDPCGATHVSLTVAAGESRRIGVVLGQGSDRHQALDLASRFATLEQLDAARQRSDAEWERTLSAVQVQTPDDSFDLIVNRWLLYQTLCCRVWARSGPYQPGGAYGFRDQLQDCLALLHARPDLCREHLLRSASRQFVEGDVQHWWHPPAGRGTRTRCSDDLLWLPFVLVAYVDWTGDDSILDEPVAFLEGDLLKPDEAETYTQPRVSGERASMFEHAVRAIARASHYGAHGLPLIGSGDWNDGMNRVGHEGRGESVWLGWFLVSVLHQFAPICEQRGRTDLSQRYRDEARWLTGMLELAWDGDWYRRAYFDDGTPLGSVRNDECRLDSLTQSWAVISRAADPRRAERAMNAVRSQLVRRDAQIVLLLTPPFDRTPNDPGYIKGYLPGVRENGGQYTHAAIWAIVALADLRMGDEAMELFHLINPINHARSAEGAERYRVEPYVVVADVYAHPMHVGRGGWSWYTGSAGWMYQAAIRSLLGLRRRGNYLQLNPCIPRVWPEYRVDWRIDETTYHVLVSNPSRRSHGIETVLFDGQPVDSQAIPLVADGQEHEVHVQMGTAVGRDSPMTSSGSLA